MKIVFFGSSDFSVPFLEALKRSIVLAVTVPDKRKNRGKKLLPNPVKEKSNELGIEVFVTDILDYDAEKKIREVSPDIFVVVSYGKIIPRNILLIPKCAINLHPSRLPLYRGAAPIERQIMDGVEESAVAVIKVSEKLDRGDIILQEPFSISFADNRKSVEEKIIKMGTDLLRKAIDKVNIEGCIGEKQIGKGSYAKKITKKDEEIDWNKSCMEIYNKIRALSPYPGARTYFRGRILKILTSIPVEKRFDEPIGSVVKVSKDRFTVACAEGVLDILKVQMEGKRVIPAKDFINGARIKEGEKLG